MLARLSRGSWSLKVPPAVDYLSSLSDVRAHLNTAERGAVAIPIFSDFAIGSTTKISACVVWSRAGWRDIYDRGERDRCSGGRCRLLTLVASRDRPLDHRAPALKSNLLSMFPPHTLRCALSDSVTSGVFIDTKFHLFSRRNSSGKVSRPRPLYANSLTLKSVPYFEDREYPTPSAAPIVGQVSMCSPRETAFESYPEVSPKA